MKKCIDEKIGQMISFYEFDQLSTEGKKLFEDHLLKCDACYQEVYEFRSAVKTMKKHRKSYLWVLKSKKSIFDRIADFLFPSPMPKYRYALAGVAVVIISFLLITRFFQVEQRSSMIANQTVHDSTRIQQRLITPYQPDVMELRAAGDTLQIAEGEDQYPSGKFNEQLSRSMKAMIDHDAHTVSFSWSSVKGVSRYHIYLIGKQEILKITPVEGIQETQFRFQYKDVDPEGFSTWRLVAKLASGVWIFGENKFEFN